MRTDGKFGILEFLGLIGLALIMGVLAALAIFFAFFAFIYVAFRWTILNTFFRCKIYLPCYGYYTHDITSKLNWLKKNYRWFHITEQDIVQIKEYPYYQHHGMHERQSFYIRGVTIRFARKKYAVHFKLSCL